ncbi:hypothetical protein FUA23_00165 [Neolewinella aurantiaca]|uniref:Uncharacterized protein n=1 Tax=Neolewinella aurantiaca TaxID=2602767 RepID=A0A5C7G1A7_9BACT|nr:hypothetical protein [Neolewinella aurantiaca]TXF91632.1 hypothetical protein FUA23_00165 [Neolewinella aurantiaca]
MPRLLTLLFLSLLCTCVFAQTDAGSTGIPRGSASLLVEFGDGTWELSLSSSTRFQKYRYVTQANYDRRPAVFKNYTIVPGTDRFDLRMVHDLLDELRREGWQITATNYNRSQSANEMGTSYRESIFYHFSVPVLPENPEDGKADDEVLLEVSVAERDNLLLRGRMSKSASGEATLVMERMTNDGWKAFYTLGSESMLTDELVPRIEEINASKDKLSFRVAMANGRYDYHFDRKVNDEYYFTGLRFESSEVCGLFQYDLKLSNAIDAQLNGFYRPASCDAAEKAKIVYGRYEVLRTSLKDFQPGAQRIELKKPEQTIFY